MKHVDCLIVGAGVSGLSVANFIKSPNYLVVESEAEAGGYCRSVHKDGFVWDYSGHFFHFQNPEIEKFIMAGMRKNSVVKVNKVARILYKNQYIDFPFQKNIHQLNQEEFLECLHDLYFRKEKKSTTFKEMVYSSYGKGIAEKFLIPYNEKLYACDLDTLDKDAMGRFFPKTDLDEIMKHFISPDNKSYNSTFTYPKGGAREYINALLGRLNDENVSLNERLLSVNLKTRTAQTNKRLIKYNSLVSTIPFPNLLSLCGIKFKPGDFTSNKVLAVNLGFDKKGDPESHWVYFPEKKYRFYRVGYYDNIMGGDRMSIYVEVGMKSNEKVNVQKEINAILKDAKKAGIITSQKLIAKHYVIMDPAYVHINKKSQGLFHSYSKKLNSNQVYSIGRYGGWKYCSIEDNIVEAKSLAKQLNKGKS